MRQNKTKGLRSKKGFHPAFGSNSVKAAASSDKLVLAAAQMVKEVKAGNYQAYSEWLQQCQLRNTLEEMVNQ